MEMNYSKETVYFIAYSRLPENIPAYTMNGQVGIGLVINYKTGVIEDTSCTLITSEARQFLKEIIKGYNIFENDGIDSLLVEVKKRFHGYSQRSVCVILKEVYNRYKKWELENLK